MDKKLQKSFALLYTLAVFIFLAFFYRGHLLNAEFARMFLFTGDYLTEALTHPGGFGIYVLDFVFQFFHIPIIGAACLALILLLDSVLLAKCCSSNSPISFILSFLPSTAVMFFICIIGGRNMFNVLLAPIVILLSLSVAGLLSGKPAVLCAAAVPFVFFLFGPLSFIYVFALLNRTQKGSFLYSLAAYIFCVILSYFIFTHQIFDALLGINVTTGVNVTQVLLARIVPGLIALAIMLLPAFDENPPKFFFYSTFIFSFGLLAAVVTIFSKPTVERVLRYESMMHKEDWNGILKLASKQKPAFYEECCCVDLALAMKGKLADELFNYPQGGPMAMVPSYSNSISPLFAAEVLKQVGLFPIAQRFVFEAQVGGTVSEANARCYKLLAELNAGVGFKSVAQKYADGLSHTLFYHNWAKKFNAGETVACISDSLDLNLFYIDGNFADAIAYCIKRNPDFGVAREYMLCWYILANDLNSFAQMFDPKEYMTIPKLYLDAYTLYWAQSHDDFSGAPDFIPQSEITEIMNFAQTRSKGKEAVKRRYGKTCWYYMFYNNTQVQ